MAVSSALCARRSVPWGSWLGVCWGGEVPGHLTLAQHHGGEQGLAWLMSCQGEGLAVLSSLRGKYIWARGASHPPEAGPIPTKLQAARGRDRAVVLLTLSSHSYPWANCVTSQMCPPIQLQINSRNHSPTPPDAGVEQKSPRAQERVQRHHPIAAVRPHHSVILLVWSPRCAATCLGKQHTRSHTSPKGPGDHHRPPSNSGSTALTCPSHSRCWTLAGDHPVPLPREQGMSGSVGWVQELELSDSHFPFPQLTTACPAGVWAGSGDSAPPRGPIGLPHFNMSGRGEPCLAQFSWTGAPVEQDPSKETAWGDGTAPAPTTQTPPRAPRHVKQSLWADPFQERTSLSCCSTAGSKGQRTGSAGQHRLRRAASAELSTLSWLRQLWPVPHRVMGCLRTGGAPPAGWAERWVPKPQRGVWRYPK